MSLLETERLILRNFMLADWEALAAFTYEFTVLGTQRITAECETQNTASARVMQKCGMTCVGEGSEPATVRYSKRR